MQVETCLSVSTYWKKDEAMYDAIGLATPLNLE